ncbi:hypothetical protein VTJ04DRAFT_1273 [Mycothermus thermophilus]|uniref:uncharacterized protein n=1 Tax=Humicola insolens TaxID=85995 RepID=UPI003742844E
MFEPTKLSPRHQFLACLRFQSIHHDTWKEKKNKFVIKLKVQSKTSRPLTHQMVRCLQQQSNARRFPAPTWSQSQSRRRDETLAISSSLYVV